MRNAPVWLLVLIGGVLACTPVGVASPTQTISPTASTALPAVSVTTSPIAPPAPTTTPAPTLAIDSCGSVAKVTADGAQIVVDVVANGVTTRYNLQNQFAYPTGSAAGQADVIRAAQDVLYRLMLKGHQVAPDTGLPDTVQLRDFTAIKVVRCESTASIQPKPNAFVLPLGCGFGGSPTVGTDQSSWQFDCGEGANHDARGALAYSLAQQGWTSCGMGLGSATWMKGDLRLVVSEGSGVPGPSGLPTLTQPARTVQTGCG
jgi:hypothetical protein